MDYHQRALKMREKFYPSGHVDIARSLDNIGVWYENQRNKKVALEYYNRALIMYKKLLQVGHADIRRVENNIGDVTK